MGLRQIGIDFREDALSSRKSKGNLRAHARGAVSELRLAIDLPVLQGSSRIQSSCNTCFGKTLFYYSSSYL